jgi:hypothetical protein
MSLKRGHTVFQGIYFGSLCLLSFCVPVFKFGIQIPIILLVLSWLTVPKLKLDKRAIPILVFISIYLFHLLGMIYTENVDRGNRDLIQKLSLLIFPIVLGTGPQSSAKQRRAIFRFFTLGTLVAVGLAFASSAMVYSETGEASAFYMSDFSPVHHPSYLAFYMVMAIAFLLLEIERTKRSIQLWIGVFFLSLSLIFPASKIGFINFAVVLIIFLFRWTMLQTELRRRSIGLLVLGFSFSLFLVFDPVASFRIERAVEVTVGEEVETSDAKVDGTSARLEAWKISLDLLRRNPWGYGTGDINDVLVETFRDRDLDQLADKELNPHNEFLQISLAQGLPAAAVFLFSLLYPLGRIVRKRDWLYGLFLVSVFIQFGVESMLEKQSGVIFFAFFNALLFFSTPQNSSENE